jgi:LuxR family transcriptional regulator, quorum-sensing system regulator SolR
MKAWQEEQVQSLLSSTSAEDLFSQLAAMAKILGFDYCAYGIRMPLPISQPRTEMFNNYPGIWQQCYQEQNYLAVDPTVVRASRSTMPFVWSDELFVSARDLWEDAKAHGLEYGWAQSCRDVQGISGMLTLSRSQEDLSDSELRAKVAEMIWLVQMAHLGMSRCLTPKLLPEAEVVLSNREIEVLRWTAEGKTSGEVADILRIAERTVNFHISNATIKLNANNKTAAVIRASVLGLLY